MNKQKLETMWAAVHQLSTHCICNVNESFRKQNQILVTEKRQLQ